MSTLLPDVEALRLAHGGGGDHAIGRAVGRDLAFLVAGDHAGAGDARDRVGGVLGAFDGRLGGNAGFVAEILDPRAGVLETGADLGRPARSNQCAMLPKKPRLLGRGGRGVGALLRQRQRGGQQNRGRANAGQQRDSRQRPLR